MSSSPRLVAAVVCLTIAALAPTHARAQAGGEQVREGNRLYEEGRFQEAHEKYLEGLAAAPESPVIRFNDGNALYRSEDYQRALEAYRGAIESPDPELAGAAWYNLGNSFYRQQQLEPSLEAYKQALRLRPEDMDAKHNLERVLQELQQQQQNQQNQQDDPDQRDEQQNQDQARPGPQDEDQQGRDEPRDQPQDQQARGDPQRQPGQMTPEEAERLLGAIDENPDDVERRPVAATGRRPRRPW